MLPSLRCGGGRAGEGERDCTLLLKVCKGIPGVSRGCEIAGTPSVYTGVNTLNNLTFNKTHYVSLLAK